MKDEGIAKGVEMSSWESELSKIVLNSRYTVLHNGSLITSPIRGSIFPSLIRLQTIKRILPQLHVHFVVPVAQPFTQRLPTPYIRRSCLYRYTEIRCAMPARVKNG